MTTRVHGPALLGETVLGEIVSISGSDVLVTSHYPKATCNVKSVLVALVYGKDFLELQEHSQRVCYSSKNCSFA